MSSTSSAWRRAAVAWSDSCALVLFNICTPPCALMARVLANATGGLGHGRRGRVLVDPAPPPGWDLVARDFGKWSAEAASTECDLGCRPAAHADRLGGGVFESSSFERTRRSGRAGGSPRCLLSTTAGSAADHP